MLSAEKPKSARIEKTEKLENGVVLYSQEGMCRLLPITDKSVRITFTEREKFSQREKPGVVQKECGDVFDIAETEEEIVLRTKALTLRVNRGSGAISYYRASGELLLRERQIAPREMEEFQSYTLSGEAKVEKIQTADGVKEIVQEAARTPAEKLFHTRLHLELDPQEGVYGLGQHEEGYLNLRGKTIYVHQANRKIAVPVLVSSKGYGILMDTYSPMIFNDTSVGSYLYTEADDELDYYFMAGDDLNEVVRQYRMLTGKAAMLPKWAFGYLQSQERYETAQELIQVAGEYRKRGLGLDCIILDWISWEDGMWGQKSFDPVRFANPTEMMDKLHEMNVHFMMSIWPNMTRASENFKEMNEEGEFLKASDVYNALSEQARKVYWNQVSSKLFCHGVDGWWCDSSEPLTVEWVHKTRMEPGVLYASYCREMADHMPAWAANAFPYYHARTIYEGQRGENETKRVCNLTRSAYTGQQRLGTILWSGDTSASWKTFREQIAAGQGFTATGLPYWTMDIGAFFVKKSNIWYWDGEFDDTTQDARYRELYARWFQWAAFLPVFRAHGTDCRREMWAFGEPGDILFDAMEKASKARYRLMPYIYSQAGRVWLEDASMMKPLVFDYPQDEAVLDLKGEYLFCDTILVCPVTEPLYYGEDGQAIDGPKTHRVYLPKGNGWYDMNDNRYYEGGQWVTVDADIRRLPCFIKEGSLLVTGQETEWVQKQDKLQFTVYSGRDFTYALYQDEGDGYAYERGGYTLQNFVWNEAKRELRTEDGAVIEACIVTREV